MNIWDVSYLPVLVQYGTLAGTLSCIRGREWIWIQIFIRLLPFGQPCNIIVWYMMSTSMYVLTYVHYDFDNFYSFQSQSCTQSCSYQRCPQCWRIFRSPTVTKFWLRQRTVPYFIICRIHLFCNFQTYRTIKDRKSVV